MTQQTFSHLTDSTDFIMITLEECKNIHFSGAREYLRCAEKYLNDMLRSIDSPDKETARLHCAVLHNLRCAASIVDGLENIWGVSEEEWESEEEYYSD